MNLIYEIKSLKVISIISGNSNIDLKQIFPKNFKDFGVWRINKDIQFIPNHLKIVLDSDKLPDILLYKNKEIYKRSDEEKKAAKEKKIEDGRKALTHVLPRNLRSSMGFDIVKFWSNSPYTSPFIANSLKDLSYFSNEKLYPISWWGPFTDAGGYANMNREIIFRLHNHHVMAKAEICPTAPQISPTAHFYLSKHTSLDFRRLRKTPKVWSFTPVPTSNHGGRNIFFTMMETETLHPEFVRLCNTYSNEIWVPSNHNRKVFAESGVKKSIYVMPLGIDETLYKYNNNSELGIINDTSCFVDLLGRKISEGINKFRFITLFGWSYRKGIDVLIKSFVEEFTDDDDVALIICSRRSGSPAEPYRNIIRAEALRFAKDVRQKNYPQIILYPHIIPEQQMPSIYKMGHAFVHYSRGEGFSLPQIEAAACNLPVISCNNTGMSEYLNDDNAYLVKTNEKEICSPEMHWISGFYHGQLFPKLGRDQINQARNHMRFVRNNYEESKKKAKIFKEEVFQKYTWQKVVERVATRIKSIHMEN